MTYNLSGLGDAASVTVVSGSSLARVHAAFGVDPRTSEVATGDDVYGGTDGFEAAVCASQVDDHVMVVEVNGYFGSLTSTLRNARTEGTRCGNVFWNHDDDLPQALLIDSDGSVHEVRTWRSSDLESLPPALRPLGSELIAHAQEYDALDLDNTQIIGYYNGFVDTLGRMLETFTGLGFPADLTNIAQTGLRRDPDALP
ncbi:MAG: hypothetical protein Q7T73_03390 [Beijerinckiaceae bacterium]|nr:hypothetical protein [Beijerinckiaceae bacterium]